MLKNHKRLYDFHLYLAEQNPQRMRSTGIYSVIVIVVILFVLPVQAQSKLSREEYIEKFSPIAIREMNRCGVPASIILAQGMLESDNGNSRLAVKGNNHFGIKCHNGWQGKKIYHDDDARNECFRKYNSVEESFIDHSDFLKNTSRYSGLFSLDRTDYKAWAHGLKKAGYATSPKYAELLIKIIEDNNLHRFDLADAGSKNPSKKQQTAKNKKQEGGLQREILVNNRIKYIVGRQGDTQESITREMKLLRFELGKYNDLREGDSIIPGKIYYLQPKRNQAARGTNVHTVAEGETIWDISQLYGVKPARIYEMNQLSEGKKLSAGDRIYIRKPKAGIKPVLKEEPIENDKIIFEFEQ